MKLLTVALEIKLLANGRTNAEQRAKDGNTIDFPPVVKIFTPDGNASWWLSEIDPTTPNIAFGMSDLGLGFSELGSVDLTELRALRGSLGLPVERDQYFFPKADKPVSAYGGAA